MYGKVMSIPDAAMSDWHRLLAMGDWPELGERLAQFGDGDGDPMALKHELANSIVARVHDIAAAAEAGEVFRRVVQRKEVPDHVPEVTLALAGRSGLKLVEMLVEAGLAPSKSEARRLVQQGGVSVDREKQSDPTTLFQAGSQLIQVGKRRYAKVVVQ